MGIETSRLTVGWVQQRVTQHHNFAMADIAIYNCAVDVGLRFATPNLHDLMFFAKKKEAD
jgi:hypothetical protein